MDISTIIRLWIILIVITFTFARQLAKYPKDVNTKLLATMKSYMDPNANPCQDFYRYACGNWEKVHRNVSKYVDTVGSLDYVINHRVKMLLKARHFKKKAKSNLIYHKVQTYYKTCEEQRNFNAKYYLNVIKPLNDVEWPEVADTWLSQDSWNVWTTLGRLQAVGFNGFPLTLELKPSNATSFHLELDTLDSLGYTAYEQQLLDVMEDSLDGKSRKLAANIQKFIKELIAMQKSEKEFGSQEMTIKELNEKIENVDFVKFFKEILDIDNLENLVIKVYNFKYFEKLGKLIVTTSPETLIHTIKLKFLGYLEKLMPAMQADMKCLHHMRDLVPLALDYMYEQEIYRYERNNSDIVIKKIFRNMQEKFKQIIEKHSHEFSPEEISFMQKKILHMQLNIGNLPMVKNHQFYFHYFHSWKVRPDDFYWNHISALQHYYREKYKMLNIKHFSPFHTFFAWPYGSPAYQPSTNLLIIPHAYLRFPIYHAKFHDLFLYAELGNALGHEMLHAFDMNGLKYDAVGNPSMKLLSSLLDNSQFLKNLQCLHEQRPSSINELIADFGGFHLAYESYFESAIGPEFRGNTSLSNRQLFFIKFAQFFCAISPSHITYDDSHDTPFRRVPQVVANHREFEEVFSCPVVTVKKRAKKCQLW